MKRLLLAAMEKPGWRPGMTVLFVGAFLFVTGAIAWRTSGSMDIPGKTEPANGGMNDFNDATWFPVQFFLRGGNPLGEAYRDFHPQGLGVSLYSPFHYLLHAFYGPVPLESAQWIQFLLIAVGLILLGWVSLSSPGGRKLEWTGVFLVAAFLAASRTGYGNLYSGQVTVWIALGMFLALTRSKTNPVQAGIGLLLVSLKPNFLVPLGFLMLFRRDFRALLWGAAFSVAGAGIAISMMALRGDGFGAFFRGIFETYLQPGSHPEVAGVEEIGWLIVSPGAFLSHWMGGSSLVSALVAVILIGLSGFLLLTTKYRGDRLDSPAVLLVLLTVILSVFHAAYDLLLLAGPVVAMVFGLGYWEKSDLGWRVVLTVLLVVPMFNYLSTNIGKGMLDPPEGLWSLICVSNAVLLTAAYVILAVKMIRSRRENGGPITGTDA